MDFGISVSLSSVVSAEVGGLGSEAVEWEEAVTILESGSAAALATANWERNPASRPVFMA